MNDETISAGQSGDNPEDELNLREERPSGDVELPAIEEEKLRSLLTRAADGIKVVTPPEPNPEVVTNPGPQQSGIGKAERPARDIGHLGRWIGVAAAVLVVAVVGGIWRQSGGRAGNNVAATFDTGASDAKLGTPDAEAGSGMRREGDGAGVSMSKGDASAASVEVDPRALVAGGIWRLPEASGPFEVTGVQTHKRTSGFQVAVDNVDEPSSWFAVLPTRYWMNVGGQVKPQGSYQLANSMTATLLRPDTAASPTSSTWIDLEQDGDALNALTFVYRGVTDDEAMATVKEVAASIAALRDAGAVKSALLGMKLPDGLIPTWDDSRIGYPSDGEPRIEGVDLALRDADSGERFSVTLIYSGLDPNVARLEQLFGLEASMLNSAVGANPVDFSLSRRLLTVSQGGTDLLFAFTEDGVGMNVGTPSHANPSVAEQLRVLASLRPFPESEFRRQMREQGVKIG